MGTVTRGFFPGAFALFQTQKEKIKMLKIIPVFLLIFTGE